MVLILQAACVTNKVQRGAAIVGFADDEFKTKHYLLLQRQLAPTEQDRKFGHDRIHIERDSPKYSAYGGIEECRLEDKRLLIRLDPKTAKDVSKTQEIEVRFNLGSERLAELREALRQLTAGSTIFVDSSQSEQ
jgi:hypothetical protein